MATTTAARRLRPLIAATGLSTTGDGMFAAAAGLLAVALTRNPVTVALVETVMFGTRIVFQIPAGAVVDRWPRRRVMIAADTARAVVLAALTAFTVTHTATVPVLLGAVGVVTAASCFFSPAAQAVIPETLGRDEAALNAFNGRYWLVYSAGKDFTGPPLGSAAFAAAASLPFAADAVSFLGSAALIRRLPAAPAPATLRERPRLTAGLAHLFRTRELRAVTLGVAADNLGSAALSGVFVLYARQTLHVPPAFYGLLLAAAAPAAVLAGLKPGLLTDRLTARQVIAVCCLAQAAAWAALAAHPGIWAAITGMLVLGAASIWESTALSTTAQALTPPELLGAVWAAILTLGVGAAGLGALAGGITAGMAGLNAAVILAAVILAAAGIALLRGTGAIPS